jgi:uncharacterized membrane protein
MNRVNIAGHPIHPMLVTIPIGLWVFSLVCDLVFASTGDRLWLSTAYLCLGGGIIGAVVAAIPGLFDMLALRHPVERRTAVTHMAINLGIVVVQIINFWLRSQENFSFPLALALSVISVGALVVSGWLGGHLVHVLGVTQPGHESHVAAAAEEARTRRT